MNIQMKAVTTVISLVVASMLTVNALAADKKVAKPERKNSISDLRMNLDVGKVKNLISDSATNSKAQVKIGVVNGSTITGLVEMGPGGKRIKVGNVINEITGSGDNNKAIVEVSSIYNSTIENATIDLDIKGIQNTVKGTGNNWARVSVGAIKDSEIKNKADIKVTTTKTIINQITGGSGNRAVVRLGTIENAKGVQDATINIDSKGEIKNSVSGTGSKGFITIGSIMNTSKVTSAKIDVKIDEDITNTVGGKGNNGEVSIGAVY